jgi:hypothetical protein
MMKKTNIPAHSRAWIPKKYPGIISAIAKAYDVVSTISACKNVSCDITIFSVFAISIRLHCVKIRAVDFPRNPFPIAAAKGVSRRLDKRFPVVKAPRR